MLLRTFISGSVNESSSSLVILSYPKVLKVWCQSLQAIVDDVAVLRQKWCHVLSHAIGDEDQNTTMLFHTVATSQLIVSKKSKLVRIEQDKADGRKNAFLFDNTNLSKLNSKT